MIFVIAGVEEGGGGAFAQNGCKQDSAAGKRIGVVRGFALRKS